MPLTATQLDRLCANTGLRLSSCASETHDHTFDICDNGQNTGFIHMTWSGSQADTLHIDVCDMKDVAGLPSIMSGMFCALPEIDDFILHNTTPSHMACILTCIRCKAKCFYKDLILMSPKGSNN